MWSQRGDGEHREYSHPCDLREVARKTSICVGFPLLTSLFCSLGFLESLRAGEEKRKVNMLKFLLSNLGRGWGWKFTEKERK